MSQTLTEKLIKHLKPPTSGNKIEWDSKIPGFGVRITTAGFKSYVLDYRANGEQYRYTIARCAAISLEEARKEAGRLQLSIRQGVADPVRERWLARKAPTMHH